MIFNNTRLNDVRTIDLQPFGDDRGMFARTFCSREFADQGLPSSWVQQNFSSSAAKGTIRGMHFQYAPYAEAKLVRCIKGKILDVIVDLRSGSSTYLQWESYELDAENGRQLFVPTGFAHSFQTLTDNVEVSYLVTSAYKPEAEAGLRYDDPLLNIDWPLRVSVISPKDANWPLLDPSAPLAL